MPRRSSEQEINDSLNRLLLSSRIRQLLGHEKPITIQDMSTWYRLAPRLLQWTKLSDRRRISSEKQNLKSRVALSVLVLFLSLEESLFSLGNWKRSARRAYRRLRYGFGWPAELTNFVNEPVSEIPMIRMCLLLWSTGRYGECVEILIERYRSGLHKNESGQMLHTLLNEINDHDGAVAVIGRVDEGNANPVHDVMTVSRDRPPTALRYGLIMPTMFDSANFRRSLISVLQSDFPGEVIVVEDGFMPGRASEQICNELSVKYFKRSDWTGALASVLNLGISKLADDVDIVIYAHSDVLFPSKWFSDMNLAWEKVWDSNRVGIINLGYLEPIKRDNVLMKDLFNRGDYSNISWVLSYPHSRASRMIYHNPQNPDRQFGLATWRFNDRVDKLHLMTGRFSPVSSFPKNTWHEIGGFDPDIAFGSDAELHYYNLRNRLWTIWARTPPLIHLQGSDTITHLGNDIEKFLELEQNSRNAFERKYGWDIIHFIFTYFAETTIIYYDEIVDAVNDLRFSDIDHVFDDFWYRLKNKTLSTCELIWCQSRSTCKYTQARPDGPGGPIATSPATPQEYKRDVR